MSYKIKCIISSNKKESTVEKFKEVKEEAEKIFEDFCDFTKKGEANVFLLKKSDYSETYKVVRSKAIVN